MAKDPVLPLYYNDLTTSTQDWNDEEFGAYVRLLIHQWRQGGLPKDYQRLTRIATSLDTNWALIKPKFVEVDGLLKNLYMEEVREKRVRHKEKQRENVLKRYQKSTKDSTNDLPLEEEKENEKENSIKKESQLKLLGPTFQEFWDKYDKKVDRLKSETKWARLSTTIQNKIMQHLDIYIPTTPDPQFRKSPATYLNNQSWNDEVPKPKAAEPPRASKSTNLFNG